MKSSSLSEVLLRNSEIFTDKRVVITGDVPDAQCLNLLKTSAKATVILDNYVVAVEMAALMGQRLGRTLSEKAAYKHIEVCFSPIERIVEELSETQVLVLFLNKSKQQTLKLLNLLQHTLVPKAEIFILGQNQGGGKSADSILKRFGQVAKFDSARKCTLYRGIYEKTDKLETRNTPVDAELLGHHLHFLQDEAVFSNGRIDEGTAMLLASMAEVPANGALLDLGCGCGVIGITLARAGFSDVTSVDVSAQALALTERNAQENGVELKIMPSDMLTGLGSFDVIAVNPPFHQGINTTTGATRNMILHAPEHLNKGGAMYLVGNSFLGYERILREAFEKVEILKGNSRFTVFKAQK